jgi:hypothetical protein
MFRKFATKYGLASHLGMLVGLPIGLAPFVSSKVLADTTLWLILLAVIWILFEPSIRMGERLSQARARVRKGIFTDLVFWFLLSCVLIAFFRWMNSGISLAYEPMVNKWVVKSPAVEGIPACVEGYGYLPFVFSVALSIFIIGIRHAVGLKARICCGIVAAFFVGLGGIAAAISVCAGWSESLVKAASLANLTDGPFIGSIFGVWLLLSTAFGAQSESCKWGHARLPFYIAIAGNGAGLIFFAPTVVSEYYLLATIVMALFCLVWLSRTGCHGSVPRALVVYLFGLATPVFLLKASGLPELISLKMTDFDPTMSFSEVYVQVKGVLSNVALKMWDSAMWFGKGLGSYKLNLPFLVEQADWSLISAEPQNAVNGYYTLIAERGIVGCMILVALVGVFLWMYLRRYVIAFVHLRHQDDADPMIFSCMPIAWASPIALIMVLVEVAYTSVSANSTFLMTVVAPLVLAAASFPKPSAAAQK